MTFGYHYHPADVGNIMELCYIYIYIYQIVDGYIYHGSVQCRYYVVIFWKRNIMNRITIGSVSL